MSVAVAMAFIRRARTDPAIRAALEGLSPTSARAICAIGVAQGLSFSEDDFDRAFKIEWAARWAHYGNPPQVNDIDEDQ